MKGIPEVKQLADVPYVMLYESLPHGKSKGKHFTIAYGEGQFNHWAISYGGSSHYFNSSEAALSYACGRGWVKHCDIPKLEYMIHSIKGLKGLK